MEPFSLYNPRPPLSRSLRLALVLRPAVSPSAPLLPVAVYKSGRRLYPPTTMHRMEEGRTARGGRSQKSHGQREKEREGLGATRSVPPHPAQRCNLDALWERTVTGIAAVSRPGHVFPLFSPPSLPPVSISISIFLSTTFRISLPAAFLFLVADRSFARSRIRVEQIGYCCPVNNALLGDVCAIPFVAGCLPRISRISGKRIAGFV